MNTNTTTHIDEEVCYLCGKDFGVVEYLDGFGDSHFAHPECLDTATDSGSTTLVEAE